MTCKVQQIATQKIVVFNAVALFIVIHVEVWDLFGLRLVCMHDNDMRRW
jgi:hypothetical protein